MLRNLMPNLMPQSATSMTITVEIREVYGEQKVYPICDKAQLFANIAGTKTLTHHTLIQVEQLGYLIQVQRAPIRIPGLKSAAFN